MFELFNLSKNVVKNIVEDIRKDKFTIKYESEELEDYHKNSISFSFFSNSISVGNLDILWKQTLLNHEIYILKERNKIKSSKLERLVYTEPVRPDMENILRRLEHQNSEINCLLKSKLDSSVNNYYTLKDKILEEYADISCFSLLKKLYKETTQEKFVSEGQQDSFLCFITINEYVVKEEFFSCVNYYDYQTGDEYDHDAYIGSYTE